MVPYSEKEEKAAKSTKTGADDMQASMQKSMIMTMPLFTLFFGMKFPSGLTLYWLVFSLVQMYQQYRVQGLGGLKPYIKALNLIKSRYGKK